MARHPLSKQARNLQPRFSSMSNVHQATRTRTCVMADHLQGGGFLANGLELLIEAAYF